MKAKDLSLEELQKYKEWCTVGDLLDFITNHNVSRDSKILVERVEDKYYEELGWSTIKKEGDEYWSIRNLIDKAKSGVFNNKKLYPRMTEEKIVEILDMENQLDESKDEYHPVWSPVLYKDDVNLYLNLHY